jgi:hypothetical protein
MNLKDLKTLKRITNFLEGAAAVALNLPNYKSACQIFLQKTLKHQFDDLCDTEVITPGVKQHPQL